METKTIETPFTIPQMGTSGLRMKQEEYNRPGFLEQFTEGIALYFKEITSESQVAENNTHLLLGGDPREGNSERVKIMASILAAHGFTVIIPENGLASTPAISHAIRHLKTAGGIVLTASHNPFTDVGVKINTANGAPALSDCVDRVHTLQNSISSYSTTDFKQAQEKGLIKSINIIQMYTDLMDAIFDLNAMKQKISTNPINAVFDSMNGAAGPFAREVFINRLGLNALMLREEPRADLGGFDSTGEPMHPEPDFDYVGELIKHNSDGSYAISAAWDSDVDRRLDGGSGFFVESADEFAIFARYSHLINLQSFFPDTIYFCRSTVTADAIDKMAEELTELFPDKEVKVVQTPTGFKWIAELGNWGVEESNGVGNPALREKDGIFATVFLLKIILETGKTPKQLIEEIWRDHGRVYFTRGEVSGSDSSEKEKLQSILTDASKQVGKTFGTLQLKSAGSWDYTHPITGETAEKVAAFYLEFSDGNSVKARFSGTGSGGYTLRIYCSKFDTNYSIAKSTVVKPMKEAFDAFLLNGGFKGKGKKYTDSNQPDIYK
ncbi:MAG: hypothetical protein PF637_03080 [Spirochaetes bacterium]|jgi:phosphoglucomutase|nr:hypothetical protein [Spirochaetota bacterium]